MAFSTLRFFENSSTIGMLARRNNQKMLEILKNYNFSTMRGLLVWQEACFMTDILKS